MVRFGKGARGFLVTELQLSLKLALGRKIGQDGNFGEETRQGVIDISHLVSKDNADLRKELTPQRAFEGEAGEKVWSLLGREFPQRYARCLNLTSVFEGTGFGGSCGPKQTGDTAGVTYGIIGFTSYNGELQELLATVGAAYPEKFQSIGLKHMGVMEFANMQNAMFSNDKKAFERWALIDGSVRSHIKTWLAALGETDIMRRQQMAWANDRYYRRAKSQAEKLFGLGATDQQIALMFDVAVQNGGLKELEILELLSGDKVTMRDVIAVLIKRLTKNRRPEKIIRDVESRKNAIAAGKGVVHGIRIDLSAYALL